MQTNLAEFIRNTPEGQEAAEILGKCVHCGFCTATCPTYQLLGDELDGPRGRIYLIKQVLEGVRPTAKTQLHLDRCLTCRNCETTCPSGVQYGRLVDIGRKVVDEQVPRPFGARLVRGALKAGLTSPLFGPAMKLGQLARPLLPASLKAKVPAAQHAGRTPGTPHPRRMLMLAGCVQPAMAPNINAATLRVFDALGIELVIPAAAGCCGAIRYHLSDHDGGLRDARANIDAWWPHLEAGCEAIVMNASGPPCTLQHAQQIRGEVESLLAALGVEVMPAGESHFCCGSAGTYSVLQPELAHALRDRRLGHLEASGPDVILSANIGCITHLASGTERPVRHWIEWLDAHLTAAR